MVVANRYTLSALGLALGLLTVGIWFLPDAACDAGDASCESAAYAVTSNPDSTCDDQVPAAACTNQEEVRFGQSACQATDLEPCDAGAGPVAEPPCLRSVSCSPLGTHPDTQGARVASRCADASDARCQQGVAGGTGNSRFCPGTTVEGGKAVGFHIPCAIAGTGATPLGGEAYCESTRPNGCGDGAGSTSINDDATCRSQGPSSCAETGAGATSLLGDARCEAGGPSSCGGTGTGATAPTGEAVCETDGNGSCGGTGAGAISATGEATCRGAGSGSCGSTGVGAASITDDATCTSTAAGCGSTGIGAFSVTGDARCDGGDDASCGGDAGLAAASVTGKAACDDRFDWEAVMDAERFRCIDAEDAQHAAQEPPEPPAGPSAPAATT